MDVLSYARLGVALAFMSAASVMDWRSRRVPDRVWIALGVLGIAVLAYEMLTAEVTDFFGNASKVYGPAHFLVFVPIGILFLDSFWDREPVYEGGKVNPLPILLYVTALASVALLLYLEGATREVLQLLTVPAMIVLAVVFYYTRLLHGGADAKAMMALAMIFPFYPVLEGLPLISYPENMVENIQMTFPFAFLIIMNAAILQVLTVPLGLLFRNLARGDRGFPEMFLGYRMKVDDIPKKFVWPMELVRNGEVVMILFPKRGGDVEAELAALKARGIDEIWVTPKVPFMIPMLLGIIFSAIVGNLVLLMFSF